MGEGTWSQQPEDGPSGNEIPAGATTRLPLKKRLYRLAARADKQLLRKIGSHRPKPKPVRERLPLGAAGSREQMLGALRRSDIETLIDYRKHPLWREELYERAFEGLYLKTRSLTRHVIRAILISLNAAVRLLRRRPHI